MDKNYLEYVQEQLFKAMIDLDNILESYGLKYSLAYGTAIGAARHGGFIPWDDDFDILMPRKDYELLLSKFKENELYKLCKPGDDEYYYPFAKFFIKKDKGVEENRKGVAFLWIDIFPVDKLNMSKKLLRKYKSIATKIVYKGQIKPPFKRNIKLPLLRNALYFIRWIEASFYSFNFLYDKMMKLIVNNFGETNIALIWNGSIYTGEPYNYNFDDLMQISFKYKNFSHKFFIFKDYDGMLKSLYGDYLKLPPIENRKSDHTFMLDSFKE